jgi:purine-cytosine permease-like protein
LSRCTPFATVILVEHFVVRKFWIPYDVDAWDTPSKLPLGLAASFTFLAGAAVAFLCADQSWLFGPIAKAFGGFGADIGFECSFGVVALIYVPLRLLEFRMFKK